MNISHAVPHVCFVSTSLYPVLAGADIPVVGGAEVQQTMIARALRRRGYRVSVLTGDFGVPPHVTPEGIEVHHLPALGKRGVKGLRWIHPRLSDVVRALRRIGPDVVYFRAAGGLLAACAWYARRDGRRVVYAAASDADFRPGRVFALERHEAWLYRRALRHCHAVVVQNQEQQQVLRERFGIEGRVVPNCYEEPGLQPGRADGPVIWVGTVKPLKRPELFLELARRFPQRRFVLVGGASRSADAQQYFESVRRAAAGSSQVDVVGFVPFAEVGRRYDGASVLINTSEVEGFPNTFLQAWARGVPSLSFVAPSAPDGSRGTIACADLETMVARLQTLLVDEPAWQSASDAALRHFERWHSVDAVAEKYDMVFDAAPGAVRV
jgi:glycosyltransferase involved in cell wall biosynthesis